MNTLRKILFVIALSPLSVQAGWFGSYDDCILENMKGVNTVPGAFAVKKACRSKYPMTKDEKQQQCIEDTGPYADIVCYDNPDKK